MAIGTHGGQSRNTRNNNPRKYDSVRQLIARYFLIWVVLAAIIVKILPGLLSIVLGTALDVVVSVPVAVVSVAGDVVEGGVEVIGDIVEWAGEGIGDLLNRSSASGTIAPLFTDEVAYWEEDIARWSQQYSLDPNLMATVMQIESCGHPTVSSSAGAQGLFQVMPFHFASDEQQLDPDTNAMRGAGVLNSCLDMANGDAGLAMACYNGGPRVLSQPFETWLAEPQRYYTWGTGIYADAQRNSSSSDTLNRWLEAGGGSLCEWASTELGLN